MGNYLNLEQLKTTLEIDDDAYYADDDINDAIEAAEQAIEGYMGSRFYPTTETRYYTASCYDHGIAIDDAVSVSSVTVDTDGNGTYDTTWVQGTDFFLDPANASLQGRPVRRLVLISQAGRAFPTYQRAVKVQGSFGWSETPPAVKKATKILSARLLKRSRDTPYAIVTIGSEVGAAARLGRIDPDVAFLLDNLQGKRTVLFV